MKHEIRKDSTNNNVSMNQISPILPLFTDSFVIFLLIASLVSLFLWTWFIFFKNQIKHTNYIRNQLNWIYFAYFGFALDYLDLVLTSMFSFENIKLIYFSIKVSFSSLLLTIKNTSSKLLFFFFITNGKIFFKFNLNKSL